MVNALLRLAAAAAGWLQEILEIVGVVLVAVFVAVRFGAVWILLVLGVAFLLKSLEVDLLSRKGGPS